ncbi:MAG: chemotaxis protein CheX [Myxococcota bacterium]|nr:chemotaxis protein CheX [Myxococcota bacterium]
MRADLITTTTNVWSCIFERPVEALDSATDALTEHASTVYASIEFGGTGFTLIVATSEHVARSWASTLFACDESACTEDDLRDVMGELANVLAGGFKARLSSAIRLGLPESGFGLPGHLVTTSALDVGVLFTDLPGQFMIGLWQTDDAGLTGDTLVD